MEIRDYRVRTPDGVGVALHHLPAWPPLGYPPVLLVPGTFTTRAFWLGARGQGLAGVLATAGFDTWVLEPRGHGDSDRPKRWTMNDWIQQDAPAAARQVLEESGADRFFWVGHSAGGVVGAAFSGLDRGCARALCGLVLVGAPGPGAMSGQRRWLGRLGYWATRLVPWARLPGRPLGLGPEPEPAVLVNEWLRWNLDGAWHAPAGHDYLAALRSVRAPVLGIAGAGDHLLAPPAAVRDLVERFGTADREVIVAGKETGFRRNYDHAGLLIGREAREEIWPLIVAWLTGRARRREEPSLRIGHA